MNEPIYVKDLFENDFIEKFLLFLYSKDLATKTYNINIQNIDEKAEINNRKRLGLDIFFNKNQDEQKHMEELEDQRQIAERYKFFYKDNEKYTFEKFLEQMWATSPQKYFFNDEEIIIEDFVLEEFIISANNFTEGENTILSDVFNVKLPFINNHEKESIKIDYRNKEHTFIKAYKLIMNEIFNSEIIDLKNDAYYKIFFIYDDEINNPDALLIDSIIQILRSRFLNFRKSFFELLEEFISFALVETFIFSAKSKFNYIENKHLDKDIQKTDLYDGVIKKLLESKEAIYREKSNLINRQGSSKKNLCKEIINKHTKNEILKHARYMDDIKKYNWINKFIKEDEFKSVKDLIKAYFDREYGYEIKSRSFKEYLQKTSSEKLSIAMFIIKNNYPIKVNTLYTKLSERSKLEKAFTVYHNTNVD